VIYPPTNIVVGFVPTPGQDMVGIIVHDQLVRTVQLLELGGKAQTVHRIDAAITGSMEYKKRGLGCHLRCPAHSAPSLSLYLFIRTRVKMLGHCPTDVCAGFDRVDLRRGSEGYSGTQSLRSTQHHVGHHTSATTTDDADAITIDVGHGIEER
jgi:hypothetical protein